MSEISGMSESKIMEILAKAKRAQRIEFMTMIGFSFTATVLSFVLLNFYQPNFVMSQPQPQDLQEGQIMTLDQAPYFDNIKAILISLLIGVAVYVIYSAFFARLQV